MQAAYTLACSSYHLRWRTGNFFVLDTGCGRRAPTGEEWVVQSIMGINQGTSGPGVVSWTDPMPVDIKASSSAFALNLPKITPYLLNPASVRTAYVGGIL
jgi:hypothetical protein